MIGANLGNGVVIPPAHVTAMETLLGLPAVTRVGLGLQYDKASRALPVWAYRVYLDPKTVRDADVSQKQTVHDALVAAIPTSQGGQPVDVRFDFETKLFTSAPELRPGSKLAAYGRFVEPDQARDYGSLGLVVTRGGSRFILTAGHVVGDSFKPLDLDVYIDDRKKSLCKQPVAARIDQPAAAPGTGFPAVDYFRNNVTDVAGVDQALPASPPTSAFGVQFAVDAALVKIEDGITNASNLLDGLPVTITTRDLSPMVMDATPTVVSVWKNGARTDRTHGVVVELVSATLRKGTALALWQLQIDATDGKAIDETYGGIDDPSDIGIADTLPVLMDKRNFTFTVDAGTPRTLVWKGNAFGRKGDSGSAIFDDTGKVIGLLIDGETTPLWNYKSSETGWGQGYLPLSVGTTGASYIKPVFARLGLDDAAIVAATKPSAAPMIARAVVEPQVQVLTRELVRTPLGGTLYRAAARHADEIARLVHHHRRVTVAYHRGKAAAYAALLIDSLRDFSTELPRSIDGRSGGDACRALFVALRAEGSPSLREELDLYSDTVFALVDGVGSVAEMLRRLEARESNREY